MGLYRVASRIFSYNYKLQIKLKIIGVLIKIVHSVTYNKITDVFLKNTK